MALPFESGYEGEFNPSVPATIPASGTTSNAVPTGGFCLCGVYIPIGFTGTSITFLVSATLAGTYVVLNSIAAGTPLTYPVVAGTYCAIDPRDFAGVAFFKIVSGSTEGSARALNCSLKGL